MVEVRVSSIVKVILINKAQVLILIMIFLAGCSRSELTVSDSAGVQQGIATISPAATRYLATATSTVTITPTSVPAFGEAAPSSTPIPTATSSPTPGVTVTRAPISKEQIVIELAQAQPPVRDDMRLAVAFRGLAEETHPTPVPLVSRPIDVGSKELFNVLDITHNTVSEIEAQLLAVSARAYFWFETGPFATMPDQTQLDEIAQAFDGIYEGVTAQFGFEASPGIDGDPRLHVLHASPQTICGVTADGEGSCGTAGFVSSVDLRPKALNPHSNEREMFVMNSDQFGNDYYLGVLAHELRHMIEVNYDEADMDWVKEGSAVLATELVGLPGSAIERANTFLANPDQQLNSWVEVGTGPYYGQGFLFNQYIYDRLGSDLYRSFAINPLPGFLALDSIAEENYLETDGESLWLDWLAALVLHLHPRTDERFKINLAGLDTAALTLIDASSGIVEGEVRQFAADYYELPLGKAAIIFEGDSDVSLLARQQGNDDLFWYAHRANFSNPRLTRAIDLRDLESATLSYDVYVDIETGYDFAYVSISLDDGSIWVPLTAEHMQGLDPEDDPSHSALAPRFYTGRRQEWTHEIIDLTPFVGQEILLRFEIVTDLILTYGGLAVDNIVIKEIGLFDDNDDSWTAEGFSLVPSRLPQPWHLQLITFEEDTPTVQRLPVSSAGQATFTIFSDEEQQRPILIVAAGAPLTLEPATYTVRIDE